MATKLLCSMELINTELWCSWFDDRKGIRPEKPTQTNVKIYWWDLWNLA